MSDQSRSTQGFRHVPRTGVIYVMHRAAQLGFSYDDPRWANLGQGAPETGALDGAPPRIEGLTIQPRHHEYSPVAGHVALRQKVADLYNTLYRQGKRTLYTHENVSVCGGGRVSLARIAAALGNINLGHFLPDYTAYEELLGIFKAFTPIPILLDPTLGYRISLNALEEEIQGRGLQALLMSNPCNPTGQLIEGDEMRGWVQLARTHQCTLILDEFYSHYVYARAPNGRAAIVSAAAYVDDIETDPVIIVDGLTKNWRYPGWRISWTLGPKDVINTIASAGSFLDGGANHPLQQEAVALLDADDTLQETAAIQKRFREKRDYMLKRVRQMGIVVESEPQGTFYVWANLAGLPPPLNDGLAFFEAALAEKVITVPGMFFDVNPGKRRSHARYQHYCRISFGPEMEKLEVGLDGLQRAIERASVGTLSEAGHS